MGWSLGCQLSKDKWKVISDTAAGFVNAILENHQAKHNLENSKEVCLAQFNRTTQPPGKRAVLVSEKVLLCEAGSLTGLSSCELILFLLSFVRQSSRPMSGSYI